MHRLSHFEYCHLNCYHYRHRHLYTAVKPSVSICLVMIWHWFIVWCEVIFERSQNICCFIVLLFFAPSQFVPSNKYTNFFVCIIKHLHHKIRYSYLARISFVVDFMIVLFWCCCFCHNVSFIALNDFRFYQVFRWNSLQIQPENWEHCPDVLTIYCSNSLCSHGD